MAEEITEESRQVGQREPEKPARTEDASTNEMRQSERRDAQDPAFENLVDAEANPNGKENRLDLLLDLDMSINVELGKTSMVIKDILELGRGSIIEFDKLVSEPVDVLVNGRKMAEGEVVVVDKHFGIRITSMADPSEHLKGMKR